MVSKMFREGSNFYQTEGIIFKRQPYRESSLLCRCMTRDFGMISLIAAGVQKEKSPFTGLLETFSQIQLELHRTQKSQIFNLRSANLAKNHLQGVSYQQTILANAAAELYLQCEYLIGESSEYYDLLVDYLSYLTRSEHQPFLIFVRFVVKFLTLLGISLEMSCIRCHKKSFQSFYPQKDGFLCADCFRPVMNENLISLKPETTYVLENIYNLKGIKTVKINRDLIEEVKNIIIIHLGNHFNKPFHLHSLNDYR